MDPRSLVLLLTAACHLLIGMVVLRHNPRGAVHRVVALQAFLFAVWAVLVAELWLPPLCWDLVLCGRVAHAICLFVCASFLTLGTLFPDGRSPVPRWLYRFVWGVAGILAVPTLVTPGVVAGARLDDGTLKGQYGPYAPLYFAFLLLCVMAGLGHLAYRYCRSQGIRRLQIRYVLTGLVLCVALNVPTNIAGPLLGMHSLGWMGPLFSLAFAGMVAHAVVRHRLMGVRVFVGQRLADLFALGVTGLLTAVLLRLLEMALGPQSPVLTLLVVLLVGLSFQPHRAALQRLLARYFHR